MALGDVAKAVEQYEELGESIWRRAVLSARAMDHAVRSAWLAIHDSNLHLRPEFDDRIIG